jgi:hypothetical protein
MLNTLDNAGRLNDLSSVIEEEQWVDFRCYIAHLWNEKKNLDAVLTDTEQILRNTYGYGVLRSSPDGQRKARVLLDVTRKYAIKLAQNPGHSELADMTGFSPEGVAKAMIGFSQLEHKLTLSDWSPQSLFGRGHGLADLFGIMLRVPQLANSLSEVGGSGQVKRHIADITNAWVSGKSIQQIAKDYFEGNETEAITQACKAIYKNIANTGTWGLSALSRMSGIDFSTLSESDKRRINTLPAMIYHGVQTEEAVLMRMNAAPRSVAENLGELFRSNFGQETAKANISQAREFMKNLGETDWNRIRPKDSRLSGSDYKTIWGLLSGEQR